MNTVIKSNAHTNLLLATIGFVVTFANWGIISGIAPLLTQELSLSATQTSIMVAIPVLLAAIGRIPMGIVTDQLGGRLVFSLLLILGIIPSMALAANHSYASLLFWGLWLGMAGTSFAIGITFVSQWFRPANQGTVLGIFGVGNAGQSVAVLLGPLLAVTIGIAKTFFVFGCISLVWGLIFALYAQNATVKKRRPPLEVSLKLLKQSVLPWVLSVFYSLTFGGFVTLSIYLPTLYTERFALPATTAGALTAAFVVVATLSRPVGGWLSDRIGGRRLLRLVFIGIALLGWMIAMPSFSVFNLSVLGCAVLLGLGNAGVFKLVPEYFPRETGTVTGFVGAAGGLGGFFPPIMLGIIKDAIGSYTLGFIFFTCFGVICLTILHHVSFPLKK
ncbi:MAG: MFS transporter [Cyanobacteria bacterium P01_F01_bin.150]